MDAVVRARSRIHTHGCTKDIYNMASLYAMCRYNIVGRLALEEIFTSNELNWNLFACNFQADGSNLESNFMHTHKHIRTLNIRTDISFW